MTKKVHSANKVLVNCSIKMILIPNIIKGVKGHYKIKEISA